MEATANALVPDPAPDVRATAPASTLLIHNLTEASTIRGTAPDSAYHGAMVGPWRTAAVYVMAGLAYAAVMTAGWLVATRDASIVWTKVAILLWTYFWPAVLAVLLVASYDRGRRPGRPGPPDCDHGYRARS